jgi:hypothetical protein
MRSAARSIGLGADAAAFDLASAVCGGMRWPISAFFSLNGDA